MKTLNSKFWLVMFALPLVAAYLLPNHYLPWPGFHAEAMAAFAFIVLGGWVMVSAPSRVSLDVLLLAPLTLVLLIVTQRIVGLINWNGVAWIGASYVVGFAFVLAAGRLWQAESPGQPLFWLVIAWIVGALLSLPIQLMQWTDMDWSSAYVNQVADGSRPFANMAQPNLLADLYLLALIGVAWLYEARFIKSSWALLISLLLLMGIALAGSRAAWVNATLIAIVFFAYYQRAQFAVAKKAIYGLFCYLFLLVISAPSAHIWITGQESNVKAFASSHVRLEGWLMLIKAVWSQPWFGFGFGQTDKANFVGNVQVLSQRGIFTQSHNLFLDYVIWMGFPIGFLAGILTLWLMWRTLKRLADPAYFHVVLCLLVLFVHAQVEFPLHYTYFLFPFALLLGVVFTTEVNRRRSDLEHLVRLVVLAGVCAAFFITVRDYLMVERGQYALRFELKKIPYPDAGYVPDVLLLDHMRQSLIMSRATEITLKSVDINQLQELVLTEPSPILMFKLAWAYHLQGQLEKSRYWLRQMCAKSEDPVCQHLSAQLSASTQKP